MKTIHRIYALGLLLLLIVTLAFPQTPAPAVAAAVHVVSPALFASAAVKPTFSPRVLVWMQTTNPAAGTVYDFKVAIKTSATTYTYFVATDPVNAWSSLEAGLQPSETFVSAQVTLLSEGAPVAITTIQ